MARVRSPTINKLLREIAKKEGITANPDALKEIARRANGDMRSALNTFQAIANESDVLELEDVESVNNKDTRSTIFDGITRVLKSKNPRHVKESLREVEEDPTLVMEYIAENVPREYSDKKEIKKAYENLAKADLYFGRANHSRNYGYWKYASDFMGIGVADSKKETYKKFSRIVTPTIFTKMSKNRGKRNLRDRIAEKMSEKLHISHSVAISMFPYLEIMFENNELAWEISDYLELEEDEIKRFRKRKIPKKVITKMEKLKNERREAEKEKRNEELKKQMLESIPEVEEIAEEEPVVEEEIIPEIEETPEPIEEEKGEPVKEEVGETKKEEPKKSKDKQVSLFDF